MPIFGPTYTPSSGLAQDDIITTILNRARAEYGDYATPTVEDHTLDGTSRLVDLADDVIEPTGLIVKLNGTTLNTPNDYTLDSRGGQIILTSLPAANSVLSVTGTNYQFYTQAELSDFLMSALDKHTSGRVVTGRSIDSSGFVAYSHIAQSLVTLPRVEQPLVALLTAIDALWTLAADAEYDIDVSTADGTSLSRMERFNAINQMIERLTDRYKDLCGMLGNVGLWRIRSGKQRRVSLTTGRLVPLYVPREIDDPSFVTRILAPIDSPAAALTDVDPVDCPEYDPVAIAGNAWSYTATVANVDFTQITYIPTASITTGSRISALVPITVVVVDSSHVTLSLTAAQTLALPPYAPWRLKVTYPDGSTLPVLSGTFLVQYPQ